MRNQNITVTINDIILRYVATAVGEPNNNFIKIDTTISQSDRPEMNLSVTSLYQSHDIIMWRVFENGIKKMILDYEPALVKKVIEVQAQ